jgi:hypothetical protein
MLLSAKNALLARKSSILGNPFFLNRKFSGYKTLNSGNSSVKYVENRNNAIEHFALFRINWIEHFTLFRLNEFGRLTLSNNLLSQPFTPGVILSSGLARPHFPFRFFS